MMPASDRNALTVHNGTAVALSDIPRLSIAQVRTHVVDSVAAGDRVAAFFGHPVGGGRVRLFAVLARGSGGTLSVCSAEVGEHYPALTPACPQAHWFEREIAEQWGVLPQGHPWLKPVRFHTSYSQATPPCAHRETNVTAGAADFFAMRGKAATWSNVSE